MKTAELTGAALDWAVAKCEGHEPHHYGGVIRTTMRGVFGPECHYSTDWAQGGPIIEREIFSLSDDGAQWIAESHNCMGYGPTALIAAMRCYVASRLGDEVEIPNELLEAA